MDFIGVDACKKGWFAVALDSKDNWKTGVFSAFADLWNSLKPVSVIFIDMPIGLPLSGTRTCDRETRKILGQRRSCVFAVPCREALEAETYHQACQISERYTGIKLSIQTWNICAKIRELDTWLRDNQNSRRGIRESHPEVCFWSFAGGRPMTYTKKSPQGFSERLDVLKNIYPQTGAIVDTALDKFMRKELARDDILDAIVLAISARQSLKSIRRIPPDPPRDENRLPMEIVYSVLK